MKYAARNNNEGAAGGAFSVSAAAARAAAPFASAPAPSGALSAPLSAPFAAAAPQQQQGRKMPPSLALAAAAKAEAARRAAAEAAAGPRDASAALAAAFSALESSSAASLLEGAEPPPGTLLVDLLPHQKVALAWMLAREAGEGGGGGLLADEQGLGKTVEAAALIGSAPRGAAPPEDDDGSNECVSSLPRGGTLVVCPNSLLHQWLAELRTKIDHGAFVRARSGSRSPPVGNDGGNEEGEDIGGIVKHHGADRKGDPLSLSRADVVVTTYDTVRVDWRPPSPQKQGGKKRARSSGEGEEEEADGERGDGGGGKAPPPKSEGPLHSVRWSRIICDEAHLIRNPSTGNAMAAVALHSASREGRGRWCLTGTPVVNGADDLLSLFAFLRHRPWCDAEFFHREITNPMKAETGFGARGEAARKLRLALQAITLRRTKVGLGMISETPLVVTEGGGGGGGGRGSAVAASGAEISTPQPSRAPKVPQRPHQSAKLPPRTTIIQKVKLSAPERKLYDRLARGAANLFSSSNPSSAPAPAYVNMMERLLRLRQACDHPLLVPEWRRGKGRGRLNTTTPLDASAAAAALELRAATTAEEKTAAAGLAPRVRAALLSTLQAQGQLCGQCGDVPEHPACVTPCRHLYCRTCALLTFPSRDLRDGASPSSTLNSAGPPCSTSAPSRPCLVCRVPVPPGGAMTRAALLGGDAKDEEEEQAKGSGAATGNDEEEEDDEQLSQSLSSFGSAKLDAMMAIVLSVAERNRRAKREARTKATAAGGRGSSPSSSSFSYVPEKVVVFSQWTSMLDLVCAALDGARVRFSRIDGGMNPAQRSAAVAAFQAEGDGEGEDSIIGGEDRDKGATSSSVSVIVVSLKAASLGLNLTAASTVVLLDPWFNRATEQQAADRAHRLGQRAAESRVVRLVAEDTVEERVVRLAEEKTRVAAAALGGERGMMAGMGAGVSGEELRFLITGQK